MKFFIDSANLDEIRSAAEMGIVCGVTTNPSLIAKEGRDYVQTLKEICEIVDGPISGEVSPFSTTAEEMVKEGREIAAMHPNMVVKIPMTAEGLKAIRSRRKGCANSKMTMPLYSDAPTHKGSVKISFYLCFLRFLCEKTRRINLK